MLPRFVHSGGSWTALYPCRPWTPADNTVGGRRVAASGLPASYIVRRDALLELTLRFHEDEWADVLAVVAAGQADEALTWYPDLEDQPGVSYAVYLEEPAAGTRWAPLRDQQYPRIFEGTLVLRGVSAAPWTPFFTG